MIRVWFARGTKVYRYSNDLDGMTYRCRPAGQKVQPSPWTPSLRRQCWTHEEFQPSISFDGVFAFMEEKAFETFVEDCFNVLLKFVIVWNRSISGGGDWRRWV